MFLTSVLLAGVGSGLWLPAFTTLGSSTSAETANLFNDGSVVMFGALTLFATSLRGRSLAVAAALLVLVLAIAPIRAVAPHGYVVRGTEACTSLNGSGLGAGGGPVLHQPQAGPDRIVQLHPAVEFTRKDVGRRVCEPYDRSDWGRSAGWIQRER